MSYGVNAPFGLQPRFSLTGGTWNDQGREYPLASGYATSLFMGDPVYYAANGTIVRATAGDTNPILGVFNGVKYIDATGTQQYSQYWLAGTVTYGAANASALILDDQNIVYDVQADHTLVNGIAAADLYQNANIAFNTAGSQYSGQSGATILGLGVTATFQVKILGFTPVPGNGPGIRDNNVLVILNNDPYKGGTGTVGV